MSNTKSLNVYFISGLGADKQAFDRLQLSEHLNIHHIAWLEPIPNESLQAYAVRMAADIDTHKPFALVGLSFGGIICIEISKFLHASKVIIVSSIANNKQLPTFAKLSGLLQLHKMGFIGMLKDMPIVMNWAFGVGSSHLKDYLKSMINKTTPNYLQWSLDSILNWKQAKKPAGLIHIHGTHDKIFPIKNVQADYVIPKGSHFMVVTHAKKISAIINKELECVNV